MCGFCFVVCNVYGVWFVHVVFVCGVCMMRDVGCVVWYGVCLVCVRMVRVCVNL